MIMRNQKYHEALFKKKKCYLVFDKKGFTFPRLHQIRTQS